MTLSNQTTSKKMIASLRQYNGVNADKPVREVMIDQATEAALIAEGHELFSRRIIVEMYLDGIRLNVQQPETAQAEQPTAAPTQPEYVPMKKLR